MCYFSDAEAAKNMHGKFTTDDLEVIAKALFPRALRLQIGCGAEPTMSQNLLQLVKLGKQYGVNTSQSLPMEICLLMRNCKNWWKWSDRDNYFGTWVY